MQVEQITADAFFGHADSPQLLAAYARECAQEGLPAYCPSREMYAAMERSGALTLLAAFEGEHLIGLLALLVYLNPHYSVPLAVVESWFVLPEYRPTGAGLALYRRAKEDGRARQACAIFVSAPVGGQLADVMQGLGARETNRVFREVLA